MTLNMKNYKGYDRKPYCVAYVGSFDSYTPIGDRAYVACSKDLLTICYSCIC